MKFFFGLPKEYLLPPGGKKNIYNGLVSFGARKMSGSFEKYDEKRHNNFSKLKQFRRE